METLSFYQIENPTTKQIFDAIINKEYVPLESILPKAKQINVLLKEYFYTDNVLVTFTNVSNTGGVPVFFGEDESIYEVCADTIEDFYNLSEQDQDEQVELLSSYIQYYTELFNLKH